MTKGWLSVYLKEGNLLVPVHTNFILNVFLLVLLVSSLSICLFHVENWGRSGIDLTSRGISIDHLSGRVGEREGVGLGVGRAIEAKREEDTFNKMCTFAVL